MNAVLRTCLLYTSNRGVDIVSAGVHDPVVLRFERQIDLFLDRQRVHIRADRDSRLLGFCRENCFDAMSRDFRAVRNSKLL